MNLFALNLSLPSLFTWAWQTSLAASVLIVLVLVLQFLFGKVLTPRWRYALWLLVAVRLAWPVAPPSNVSVFNLGKFFPGSSPSHRVSAVTGPSLPLPAIQSPTTRGQNKVISSPANAAPVSQSAPSSKTATSVWPITAQYLWLLGATGYLLTVLAQQRKMSSWVNRQQPLNDPRLAALLEAARSSLGLRRHVSIIVTARHAAPAIFGYLKPRLLLPKAVLEQLDDRELRLVILHELVHVQRRDILLNWLLILVQSVHWFNPLAWFAFKRLRAERELVRDAAVLRHLAADDRHTYGQALIKLLDQFSRSPSVPGLAPIIQQPHDLERRITMITRFKPTPRLVTLASALLLVALGCLTFTRAADKKESKAAPNPDAALEKQRVAQQRAIRVLEEEYDKYEHAVREQQNRVDKMKEELRITESDFTDRAAPYRTEPDLLHRMESLRIEAQSEYQKLSTLYDQLTHLSRAELKRTISTASPDQQLSTLFGQLASAEQKLAELVEGFGNDHPDVKRTRRLLQEVNRQVEDRLDGILAGLKVRLAAQKASLESVQQELEKTKSASINAAIQARPYFQARRDLESLQAMLERLRVRIMQEKLDAALPVTP